MKNENDLGSTLTDPLAAFANDYHWRSTKAKKQLRDRFGRWISLGANVRFRGDGAEQSGVVTSVIDGKAYIDQKNRDGSVTQKVIDPSAIRVIASKATLPAEGDKIFDENNNFTNALKSAEYKKAMQEKQQAYIERADGYGLSAEYEDTPLGLDNKAMDGTEPHPDDKDGSNPILFQLYAPGGRSLGQYGEDAIGDFDDMVNDNKGGGADTAPEGGGEAGPAESAPSAPAGGGAVAASLEVLGEEKPFRVPDAVKSEIAATISSLSAELPEADLAIANRLANDSTVSLSDVEWVHGFFAENDLSERLRGGYKGRKWASKIVAPTDDELYAPDDTGLDSHPKYQFDDDTFAYFAVGSDPGSSIVNRLISVDYETGAVYAWTPDGFSLIPDMDIAEVDEPQIIPIDEMTADTLAHWLDSSIAEDYDILDADPEERNMFSMAESELDFEELDRAYTIIAAAGDGVYTPTERSQNAKTQGRAAGGKFGETPDAVKPATPAEKPNEYPAQAKVQKARLPVALPLVADPAARIGEWLSTAAEAPVVAAGEVSGTPEYTEADQAVEDAATGPTDEALYFAIVDEIDKTAVMDAIAIVKSSGAPSAFIRADAAWKPSPDTLTILQGSTPPPVVELEDPETVKTVLAQIDDHDSGGDVAEVTQDESVQPGEAPVTASLIASGYAMSDGSYTIINDDDITEAVLASGAAPDLFVKAHIRKRARALNRMDLVPAQWREFTLAETGELTASKSVYGEFGEIVASGVPGMADTPSDFKNAAKLKNYWTRGKGALKIRWGTKGDLTRCHRHLSKYVGPQRAWGLAQSYHKSLFGVYNYTHDVATGQYSPRKKK